MIVNIKVRVESSTRRDDGCCIISLSSKNQTEYPRYFEVCATNCNFATSK